MSLINIAIHALLTSMVVRVAQAMGAKTIAYSPILLIAVMIPTVSVLMLAHALEVTVWSLMYQVLAAAPAVEEPQPLVFRPGHPLRPRRHAEAIQQVNMMRISVVLSRFYVGPQSWPFL